LIDNTLIVRNISERKGGGGRFTGHIEMKTCEFIGNKAKYGGGIYSIGRVLLGNSGFYGNSAAMYGGALCTNQLNLFNIDCCSFVDNKAEYGTFLSAANMYSSIIISNCIVQNGGQEINTFDQNDIVFSICYSAISSSSVSSITLTNIELETGNIDVDPCFVAPGYWDSNSTSNDPNDDFYVVGDYHLKSQAGHWDVNSKTWIQDEVTSPCIDAGDPNTPIMYEPFPNGGRINMGAYGGTNEASKSYFGTGPCETIIAGDINGDCKVNYLDLAILVGHWLQEGEYAPSEVDDGTNGGGISR
jgi:predicted outer membrane repeat protein